MKKSIFMLILPALLMFSCTAAAHFNGVMPDNPIYLVYHSDSGSPLFIATDAGVVDYDSATPKNTDFIELMTGNDTADDQAGLKHHSYAETTSNVILGVSTPYEVGWQA